MASTNEDFRLEKRLRRLNPELHGRYADAVYALNHGLSNYQLIFPQYTDHTILHSMNVISFCNRLIGDRLDRLNADEIFILLMGCCLHDAGMGITRKDYGKFSERIDFGDYFATHDRNDIPRIIRDFHHEYSGQFIRRYARLFEIPTPEHVQAIVQVSRGHRRTDLADETEYPAEYRVPGGNTVCLPYLAALIRLADEIDMAADRNPDLLYDISALKQEKDIIEFKKSQAIRRLIVTDSAFTLEIHTDEEKIRNAVWDLAAKMQDTLDYCRAIVQNRTPYTITQEKVLISSEA